MAISPNSYQLLNNQGVAYTATDFAADFAAGRNNNEIVASLYNLIYSQIITNNVHYDVFDGMYQKIDIPTGRFAQNIITLDFGTGATANPRNLLPPDFAGNYATYDTSFGRKNANDIVASYVTYNANYKAAISVEPIRSALNGAFLGERQRAEFMNERVQSVLSHYARSKMDKFMVINELAITHPGGNWHPDITIDLKPRNVDNIADYHTEADLLEFMVKIKKLLLDGTFPSDRLSRIDNYTIQLSTKKKVIVCMHNDLIANLSTRLLSSIFQLEYLRDNNVQSNNIINNTMLLDGKAVEFRSFNNYVIPAIPAGEEDDGTPIPAVAAHKIQYNGKDVVAHLFTEDAFAHGTYKPFMWQETPVPGYIYLNDFFMEYATWGYNPGTAFFVFTSDFSQPAP